MASKDFGEITCVDCRQRAKKNGPVQKYCGTCSEKHDLIRKAKWAAENPQVRTPEDNQQRYGDHKTNLAQRGKVIAAQHVRGIAWLDEGPALAWNSRFKYPYSQAVSKNHIYSNTRHGHVFMRSESTKAKDDIALLARAALSGRKLKHNKVWIDLLVQKANQKSDAINVIDLICDGLKVGLGVDDRWFSIRRLDWEIAKTDPQIFIGFGQEDVEDVIACSSCGRLLTFDNFNKNRSARLGITRNCKDCSRKPTLH